MKRKNKYLLIILIISTMISVPLVMSASSGSDVALHFPLSLEAYHDAHITNVGSKLMHRIHQEPLNLVVTLLFLCSIIHTFSVGFFRRKAEAVEKAHREYYKKNGKPMGAYNGNPVGNVSFVAELLYLLGEVEAVFGFWVAPVFWVIVAKYGWHGAVGYLDQVNFTEPMFVVVIMTLASTRPICRFSENCLKVVAKIGKESAAAWWFATLTIGPILGSFITEPGAMTISALLLAKQFYERKPSLKFSYATIGLLFVNISVGGTLSHFAAPPVLMVAGKWDWNLAFMFTNFGWKACAGILIANLLYYRFFRHEFKKMDAVEIKNNDDEPIDWELREDPIPFPITVIHIALLAWTVIMAHHPSLFVAVFFGFLGFRRATEHHQNETNLKPALLVGFFLSGLVIHGGLQGWWISPVLSSLPDIPLMLGATFLTAFNDNAAITYLSSLVPHFNESAKYAVMAGAVTGGGLTVIANAPNPAGVSILRHFFPYGVSPAKLALGAIIPTIIMGLCFMALP